MSNLVSRRGLFAPAAASLVMAPSLLRAMPEAPPTGTRLPQQPEVQNIQGGADALNRLTVETFINGKGPFHFVVDTGADRSCISQELAASLGLVPSEDVIVQGIARAVPSRAVELDDVRIGRVRVSNLPMPLLPRDWLGADGYLGLDVIDRQSVTFDFQNHALSIQPSSANATYLPSSQQALVRVRGSRGKLTAVDSSVDGVRASTFIDSGAEITIGNTRLFQEMQRQGSAYVAGAVVQLIGVTGGRVDGHFTRINQVKLGAVTFQNSVLVIADLPVFDVWDLADKPAMFIGMNFLRQTSALTIDYGRKELRFRLASAIRLARRA